MGWVSKRDEQTSGGGKKKWGAYGVHYMTRTFQAAQCGPFAGRPASAGCGRSQLTACCRVRWGRSWAPNENQEENRPVSIRLRSGKGTPGFSFWEIKKKKQKSGVAMATRPFQDRRRRQGPSTGWQADPLGRPPHRRPTSQIHTPGAVCAGPLQRAVRQSPATLDGPRQIMDEDQARGCRRAEQTTAGGP